MPPPHIFPKMKTLISFLILAAPLFAQPADALRIGSTLPTNCGNGEVFTKTGSGAGIYACLAGTWTPQGGAGGGTVTSVTGTCGLSGTVTGTGNISGSVSVTAHNGTYSIIAGDCGNSLTSNVAAAWSIPQAGSGGFPPGWSVYASNVGASGNVVITTTTSTFYGNGTSGSTETLAPGTAARIISDGTNWQVFYTASGLTPSIGIGGSSSGGVFQTGTFTQAGTGAVSETAQIKLQQTVNIQDYGGVCDGTTDNTAATQAAHNHLAAIGGGTVLFPSGNCKFLSNVNVTSDNIKFQGQAQAGTTITLGSAVTKLFNVTNGTSTNLVLPQFSDLSINGTAATAGSCIYLDSVRTPVIKNIYFVGCYRSININAATGQVQNVYIDQVNIEGTPDTSGARGIYINAGIGDNFFLSNLNLFADVQATTSNIGIEVVNGNGHYWNTVNINGYFKAVVIDPGANQTVAWGDITALFCDTSYSDGMTLDGTAAFGSGFPFGLYGLHFVNSWFATNGAFSGGNGNGVNIVYAQGITIDTSHIYGNTYNGVRLQNNAKDIIISHNTISGNSNGTGNSGVNVGLYDGIHVDTGSTFSFQLQGNTSGQTMYFSSTQQYGIYVGSGTGFFTVNGNNLLNNLTGPYFDGTIGTSNASTTTVIGNIPSIVNPSIAHVYFVTAPPSSVPASLPGDLASDTTNHLLYWCNAVAGTAAPACTSVTTGGWTLVGSGGGSSAFSALTGGTNTGAAMLVGTGASLGTTGSGTIGATTAAALAGTPSLCSTGQAPTGILANGNATGCASIGGGAVNVTICTATGGSANAQACPGSPVPTTYTNLTGTFIPNFANTGALTLNVATFGAKTVYYNGTVTSATVTLVSGQSYAFYYDGTNIQVYTGGITLSSNGTIIGTGIYNVNVLPGTYVVDSLVNTGGGTATIQPDLVSGLTPNNNTIQLGQLLGLTTTSASSSNYTATMALNDPITSYASRATYYLDVGATACAGGAMNLNIDGLGPVNLKQADGVTNLTAAQCTAHLVVPLIYNATSNTFNGPSAPSGGGTTATLTPGSGVTSVTCLTASCTSSRGTVSIVGGTATTGTIAALSWGATPTTQVCTATMNGGVGFLGIGNSVATSTGVNVTAGVTVLGVTFSVNYSCQP